MAIPRVKHTVKGAAKDLAGQQAQGFNNYSGPLPPTGIYHGKLKQFGLRMKDGKPQQNRNGDYMLKGLVEINEPKSSKKSKYNGYAVWFNQNISDQGVPFVNQMIDAITKGDKKVLTAFWSDKFVTLDAKGLITKIGGIFKVNPEGAPVVINTKRDNSGDQPSLTVGQWLIQTNATESDEEDADDDDFDDDDEDDDVDLEDASDEDDDEADEDEDSDSDDDESDEDDEDDEDEDESDDEEDEDDEDDDGDEEDDDEDEDESAARLAELKALDRPALVKLAKSKGIKAVKSKTTEDYINEIMTAEGEEPPF